MAEMNGSEILGRCLKNEGTKDLFFILGGPMMDAENACASEPRRLMNMAGPYIAKPSAT